MMQALAQLRKVKELTMDQKSNFLSGDMRNTIDRFLIHGQISKGIELFKNESNYKEDKLLSILEAIIEVVSEAQN